MGRVSSMDERPKQSKVEERDPFLWAIIALIIGITAIALWQWHLS